MKLPPLDFQFLRDQTVGIDSFYDTPFGKRLMVYCDFTASGRCLKFVEEYIVQQQQYYANTHTEDDVSGRNMTQLLHQAERIIKDAVHAGPHGRIIAVGNGCTAAIHKFQQLIGVALPSATRHMLYTIFSKYGGEKNREIFQKFLKAHQPVVFIGSYEHHSNELTWREGLATVEKVRLSEDGGISLTHLEELLQNPTYQERVRIGSFSAASNVTGRRTPVHEIARLLHKYNALACFDFAASAPYVEIDMNPPVGPEGGDPSIDAVFISPHKFLGGPGSCGVLVFNDKIYHRELSPTVCAGGTVSYVGLWEQDYYTDIEERERAGTPGVLQTLKAALAFQVKHAVTIEKIEKRELALIRRALTRWKTNPNIEILGNPNPELRIAIAAFNIKDPWERYLHPKFVTVLLNDLFGIQSRAGCSCAGPYGHLLLNIDQDASARYRYWIKKGCEGIKPGWCRLGFHYTMDDSEANYVIEAVDFIANKGYLFMPLYRFDLKSAVWIHKEEKNVSHTFSLEKALRSGESESNPLSPDVRAKLYSDYLREASAIAANLKDTCPSSSHVLDGELGKLQFFSLVY